VDTADRSFGALFVAGFVGYELLGMGACALLGLSAYRLGSGAEAPGLAPLVAGGVFLAIFGAGALLGISSLIRQIRASRALARRVRRLRREAPAPLADAAHQTGLAGRVRLIDVDEPFAFAYGALTPRVAVSRGLVTRVSDQELEAVLAHESYHVRRLDPLKVMLSRALPRALFFVPALRAIERRYVAGRELAADRRAMRACGRAPLAGALFKVVGGPAWPELDAAPAMAGRDLLEVRVTQMEAGVEGALPALSAAALVLSLLGAATALAAFGVTAASLADPGDVRGTAISDMALTPGNLAGAVLCAVPPLTAAGLAYGWLARRARRPLLTTTND
jgi:Zn-dependent protease with chaperone function